MAVAMSGCVKKISQKMLKYFVIVDFDLAGNVTTHTQSGLRD